MRWDKMQFRRRPAFSEASGAFADCYAYVAAGGEWRLAWPGIPNGSRALAATTEDAALAEAERVLRDAVDALVKALGEG